MVLFGFIRNEVLELDVKNLSSIVWLGDIKINWFLVVEIFGEGIFVEFNCVLLINWVELNKEVFLCFENYKKMYKVYLDEKGWKY